MRSKYFKKHHFHGEDWAYLHQRKGCPKRQLRRKANTAAMPEFEQCSSASNGPHCGDQNPIAVFQVNHSPDRLFGRLRNYGVCLPVLSVGWCVCAWQGVGRGIFTIHDDLPETYKLAPKIIKHNITLCKPLSALASMPGPARQISPAHILYFQVSRTQNLIFFFKAACK